jgi:hypothetical protein
MNGKCSTRNQTVRFAYVTSLWAEGKHRTYYVNNENPDTGNIKQCGSTAWTVHGSLPAAPPTPLISSPSTSNDLQVHSFVTSSWSY